MRHKIALIFIFLLLGIPVKTRAHDLRVHILSKFTAPAAVIHAPQAQVTAILENGTEQKWVLKDFLTIQKNGLLLTLENQGTSLQAQRLQIEPLSQQPVAIEIGKITRQFLGPIKVRAREKSLVWINEVALEDYVLAVLPSEISSDSKLEAIKAQAILVRTFALNPGTQHRAEGFDLCDLTHCQVYSESRIPAAIYRKAAESTRGMILTFHGKPALALYHSACGGHTSANQKIFGGRALAYLQGVNDQNYCQLSPNFRWERSMTKLEFEALLRDNFDFQGPFQSARVVERDSVGRALSLEFLGTQSLRISSQTFLSKVGKKIGWNQLKSPWFDLEAQGDAIVFHGRGLGHGVGLCQWGARGMATAGKKYSEILAHYFPGTKLSLFSESRE